MASGALALDRSSNDGAWADFGPKPRPGSIQWRRPRPPGTTESAFARYARGRPLLRGLPTLRGGGGGVAFLPFLGGFGWPSIQNVIFSHWKSFPNPVVGGSPKSPPPPPVGKQRPDAGCAPGAGAVQTLGVSGAPPRDHCKA